MLEQIVQLVFVLIIFLGVLGLSYIVSKKIAAFNTGIGSGKNMKVIEILPLMQGQYLYIVEIGSQYYLLGCTQKGGMTYLAELNGNDIQCVKERPLSFQEQLRDWMKGKQVKEDEKKES